MVYTPKPMASSRVATRPYTSGARELSFESLSQPATRRLPLYIPPNPSRLQILSGVHEQLREGIRAYLSRMKNLEAPTEVKDDPELSYLVGMVDEEGYLQEIVPALAEKGFIFRSCEFGDDCRRIRINKMEVAGSNGSKKVIEQWTNANEGYAEFKKKYEEATQGMLLLDEYFTMCDAHQTLLRNRGNSVVSPPTTRASGLDELLR